MIPEVIIAKEIFFEDTHVWIRTKPTKHKQTCGYCNKPMHKGEKQIGVDKLVGNNSFIREIYFHPKCFQCMITRLFRYAKVKVKSNCDKCDEIIPRDLTRDTVDVNLKTPEGENFIFHFWLRGVAYLEGDVKNPCKYSSLSLCSKCLSELALTYSIKIKEK